MAVIKLTSKPTPAELKQISEAFGDYVKVVVDVEQETVYAGCRLHADAEKVMIEKENSKQENLWGGGVDLKTDLADASAIINIRPHQNNPSQEILDPAIRDKFIDILRRTFDIP